jgi:hypothetical protein
MNMGFSLCPVRVSVRNRARVRARLRVRNGDKVRARFRVIIKSS